jgi:hypothetical protein
MALCPQCGASRVNRYCAQCGAAILAANSGSQSVPASPRQRPAAKPHKSSRLIILLPLTLVILSYFRLSAHPARSLPPASPAISSNRLGDFGGASFLQKDRNIIRLLENRMLTVQQDMDRLLSERGQVLNLHQRLSQARLQAEYEGRWPTKAAGRFLDRAQLKDAIDHSDRWLVECSRAMTAASEQLHRLSISVGQAERLLLQMERTTRDLNSAISPGQGVINQAAIQGYCRELRRLGTDFGSVVNDPSIRPAHITLEPFDVDAEQ